MLSLQKRGEGFYKRRHSSLAEPGFRRKSGTSQQAAVMDLCSASAPELGRPEETFPKDEWDFFEKMRRKTKERGTRILLTLEKNTRCSKINR